MLFQGINDNSGGHLQLQYQKLWVLILISLKGMGLISRELLQEYFDELYFSRRHTTA